MWGQETPEQRKEGPGQDRGEGRRVQEKKEAQGKLPEQD